MKTNIIIKVFLKDLLLLMILVCPSCFNDQQLTEIDSNYSGRIEGIPLIMDAIIIDDNNETRSKEYEWPDGATLAIHGMDPSDYYYAVYSKETGWTCYVAYKDEDANHYSDYFPSKSEISYSEGWSYKSFDDDQFPWMDDQSSRYAIYNDDGKSSTFYIKDGIAYINTILSPEYGRVRFSTDEILSVEYNHAKIKVYHFQTSDMAAERSYLEFHKETDGKYYSNYVYSEAIPEIRIGEYVYKYRGNKELQVGASGCISLPTSTETTTNWICEKYFEEIEESEDIIYVDSETSGFYQLYAKKTINSINKINYSDPDNKIYSSIGLTIEVDYTPIINTSALNTSAKMWFYIYNEENYPNSYYSGYSSEIPGIYSSKTYHVILHNCNTTHANWFSPVIEYQGIFGFTINRIKYSNF